MSSKRFWSVWSSSDDDQTDRKRLELIILTAFTLKFYFYCFNNSRDIIYNLSILHFLVANNMMSSLIICIIEKSQYI